MFGGWGCGWGGAGGWSSNTLESHEIGNIQVLIYISIIYYELLAARLQCRMGLGVAGIRGVGTNFEGSGAVCVWGGEGGCL